MLRRVKKVETQSANWIRPEPLDYCLDVWKDWMRTGGHRNLDSHIMGGLAGDADGHGVNLHEAQHSHDMEVAAATDAMIDSLARIHVWAIYASCSIVSSKAVALVWRFPNASLVDVAADARAQLLLKLKKNDCTANLF